MINTYAEVNWRPTEADVKRFGTSMLIGLPCLGIVFALLALRQEEPSFVLPLSMAVATPIIYALCLKAFIVGRLIYWLVYAASCSIGLVISNALLIIFYYAVLFPIAVVVRGTTGRDPLTLKGSPLAHTNWHEHKNHNDLKRYFKQY